MLRVALLAASTHSAASLAVGSMARAQSRAAVGMSFYDYSATKLDGTALSMSDFKGKPVLILNVASL